MYEAAQLRYTVDIAVAELSQEYLAMWVKEIKENTGLTDQERLDRFKTLADVQGGLRGTKMGGAVMIYVTKAQRTKFCGWTEKD